MRVVAVLVLVMALSCGGGSGPKAAVKSYGEAVQRGDFDTAYGLMSEEYRAKHTKDEFVRLMRDNRDETMEMLKRIESPRRVEIRAEFQFDLGDSMRLVFEGGQWRVSSDLAGFYSQVTPRSALRAFVRAYELKRWDIMLKLVPNDYRRRMNVAAVREQFEGPDRERVAKMMDLIKQNLGQPIEDKGNEAFMPYADRSGVEFLREDGVWKIRDPGGDVEVEGDTD